MTIALDDDWPRRVAIIGVGLLGGSVAHAIRRQRPSTEFVGFARTQEKCDRLLKLGVVDRASPSIAEVCHQSEVVVVGTPVDQIAPTVIEVARRTPDRCLITDVGSTKAGIVAAVSRDSGAAKKFVAAHPIAGSEKTGAQHASATLFDGKLVVLTPDDQTDPQMLGVADAFWGLTGARILTLHPADHDAHLATVSHVPHLVSALVARMVSGDALSLVGSGWRDITRVAAGDPHMWTAICQENRTAIEQQLDRFAAELDVLRQLIRQSNDEQLHEWLAEAKRIKEATLNN